MARKNSYARQLVEWKDSWTQAIKNTYMQYLTDTITLVLNDHGYGEQRIRKILDEWGGLLRRILRLPHGQADGRLHAGKAGRENPRHLQIRGVRPLPTSV